MKKSFIVAVVLLMMAATVIVVISINSQSVRKSEKTKGTNVSNRDINGGRGTEESIDDKEGRHPIRIVSNRNLNRMKAITQEERKAIMEIVERKILDEAERRHKENEASAGNRQSFNSMKYLGSKMKEVAPLIQECYEIAKTGNPELNGDVLVVKYAIYADTESGGVIGNVKVLGDSELAKDANLTECVTETLYSIKLEASEEEGMEIVQYPFSLVDNDKQE